MADERKPLLETLRDKHQVAAVAAQNVVDHDNPAWDALRKIAAKRAELESNDTFLVFWLNRQTGKMGLVLRPEAQDLTLVEGAAKVQVKAPRQFQSRAKAEAWCRIHANPDVVRHMIVQAVSDEVYAKTYDPRKTINRVEIDAWLATMGFEPFPEIDAWSDGPMQIPNAQLNELETWGDLIKLLDLE